MRKLLTVCLFVCLLTACTSRPAKSDSGVHPWAGALRALDPADTTDPSNDLTAVYLRQGEDGLQVRVDLLDFHNAKDLSLDIKIGDDASPGATPLVIHIPSEESPARISLDPLLATVIVEVPRSKAPLRPRVDASTPEDEISDLTLEGPVPTQTALLLLTFYDTFAGRFPAEALRRWDGAHSGPRGERHGLKHLLDAVEETQTPVVLLDLKEPQNLSALDAMGVLSQVRHLQDDHLLTLPQTSTDNSSFGLPLSLYWFEPSSTSQPDSIYRFQFTTDMKHLHRWFGFPNGMRTSIPVAIATDPSQPTPGGPSLEVRRALLDVALNADEKDLLALGGSLRDSTWGSPDMVGATLAYFASRPYIHILTADDLASFPAKWGKPELRSAPQDESLEALEAHYRRLTQPVLDFVANWQGSPLSSCETDLDQDGQSECVLANGEYLAIFDPMGAHLTYLFSVAQIGREASPNGGDLRNLHQLVGPSWQVAAGLSNPSTWDLSAGEAADPGAYPGAFVDADDPFKAYDPAIEDNSVAFTALDGTRAKTFRLTDTGIEVEYQTQKPVATQISLLVDPETCFTPGWAEKYMQEKTPGGVAWGLVNGPMVRIQSQSSVALRAFNESLALLSAPEDPDFDYPPGYTIPFPLAIAEVEMQNGHFLRLEHLP